MRTSDAPVEAIEAAGRALADAIAWRDRLSPEDAAVAAGARTPKQIADLADRIRAQRTERALDRSAS